MKPIEFYHLGIVEAPSASSEAQQRMLVGRVYYGLHHEACCRYFRENPAASPLPRTQRHIDLCRRYNTLTGSSARRVGQLLNDLRVLRSQADYELGQMWYRGRALNGATCLETALRLGQELVKHLDSCFPGEASDGCNCPTQ